MPPRLNICPGMRFGEWEVLSYEKTSRHGDRLFLCLCSCGAKRTVSARELFRGYSLSCGHGTRFTGEEKRTHGQCTTRLYKVWSSMKRRCLSPDDSAYLNYGGRGISLHPDWMIFELFYVWAMANGYRRGLTIERRNNDGNYEPSNCAWIPKGEQTNNTRRCRIIEFRREKHNIKEWALILQIPHATLRSRFKCGWSVDKAFTIPLIPPRLRHANERMKNEIQAATGIPTYALK